MEAPLVRELSELKEEILRQMRITEKLTDQAKGNKKTYLESVNSSIIKLRNQRLEKKLEDPNADIKIEEDKSLAEPSVVNDCDGDVVNEVTITSEEPNDEDVSDKDDDNKCSYKSTTKNKKIDDKNIDGM